MIPVVFIAGLMVGLVFGGVAVAALRRRSVAATALHADEMSRANERETKIREELIRAQASATTDEQMLDAFRSTAADALATQSSQFLQLAETKYGALHHGTDQALAGHSKAVDDGLKALADRLASLETERRDSTVELRTVVGELSQATSATQAEAAKLAAALRDTRVRGAWGEVQLRRVLEMAGLERHADFAEQRGVTDGQTNGRPDVIVPLSNGRSVVIDAKVPLDRYLDAVNATDPVIEQRALVDHAKRVAAHAAELAKRDYTNKVDGSIDMVLLFLPGDPFLAAAMDADPGLFESSAAKGVFLVTPSSLLPVLRGIAIGWRERQADEAAAEIQQLGVELYDRIAVFADHFATVGVHLDRTVEAFNKSVGSLDTRLLTTARRLSDRGAGSSRELPSAVASQAATRPLRAVALVEPAQEQLAPRTDVVELVTPSAGAGECELAG